MRIGISALVLEKKGAHSLAGVARYTSGIVQALLDLECEHTFVLFVGAGFEPPQAWLDHPRVEIVPVASKLRKVRSLWNALAAIPLAKRHKLDVWFSTSLAIPLWSAAPRVLTLHDLYAITHPEWWNKSDAMVFAQALRFSVPRAEHLLSVSQFTKDEAVRLFRLPEDRITVTWQGPGVRITRAERSPASRGQVADLGVPFDRYFFSIGTLEPRKNLMGVVRAAAAVGDELRALKAGVVFAGAKGWKSDGFLQQIGALGVGDLVHFLGYVPDEALAALFANAEATVFPSLGEGFGLPALEAQLYGSILICSDRGAIPEVAGPGAILVDVADSAAIGSSMLAAMNLPDREERIAQGLAHAENFTWSRTAKLTLQALEKAARR
jgi:alpha-1,3-rhamnosyl/mannosyltransferase